MQGRERKLLRGDGYEAGRGLCGNLRSECVEDIIWGHMIYSGYAGSGGGLM